MSSFFSVENIYIFIFFLLKVCSFPSDLTSCFCFVQHMLGICSVTELCLWSFVGVFPVFCPVPLATHIPSCKVGLQGSGIPERLWREGICLSSSLELSFLLSGPLWASLAWTGFFRKYLCCPSREEGLWLVREFSQTPWQSSFRILSRSSLTEPLPQYPGKKDLAWVFHLWELLGHLYYNWLSMDIFQKNPKVNQWAIIPEAF